jgi:hypothetical protein
MFLLTGILLLALAAIALAPDTPLAKTLHAWLIDAPARATANATPARIVIGAIVVLCLIGMAVSAPELVAMIGFGDLATYLDAAVIAMMLTAAERGKSLFERPLGAVRAVSVRMSLERRVRPRNRENRRRRLKLPLSSADPDAPSGWAFA